MHHVLFTMYILNKTYDFLLTIFLLIHMYLAGILFASRKTVLKRCLWNKNIIFSFCYANFVDHRDQVSAQMNGKNNLRGGRAGR